MMRPTIAVAVAVLTMMGAALSLAPLQDADLKKLLPDVEGVKKSTRKLDKAAREKVEKALGGKLEDRDIPAIWEGRATVTSVGPDKTRVLYCAMTVKGPKGDVKLGVALAPEDGRIAIVKILDNKDDKALDNLAFFQQFEGFEYGASIHQPPSALDDARKKGKAGADAAAKELGSLLALTEKMHGVQADFEALEHKVDKQEDGGAEPAKRLRDAFGEVDKMVSAFGGFLQKGQLERFSAAMKASQKDIDAVTAALKDKKWADAGNALHRLSNDQCNKCHAWSRSRFGDKRNDLGIGNGYFVVGHELSAPADGPRDTFQAMATAVRKAVLILSEVK